MFSNTFPDRAVISETVAKMLLEINAVHFRADQPYTFTSGLASPVYIDCRKLISYPRIRSAIMDFAASVIFRNVGFEQFDAVAGGETAGIPFAAWLSDRMGLPMQYVRKKPKGFGRDAQIEGTLEEGARVLLVEDLTTDGGSKIKFAEAISKTGARVTDTFAVFYYDIFPDTPQKLEAAGMRLHYLATWWDILSVCKEQKRFSAETIAEVESFLNALEVDEIEPQARLPERRQHCVRLTAMVGLVVEEVRQRRCEPLRDGAHVGGRHVGEAAGQVFLAKRAYPVDDACIFRLASGAQAHEIPIQDHV